VAEHWPARRTVREVRFHLRLLWLFVSAIATASAALGQWYMAIGCATVCLATFHAAWR
jgi:hypothetical protein